MSYREIGTPEGGRESILPFQDLPLALEWIMRFTNEIFERLKREKDENIEAILTELQSLWAKLPKKAEEVSRTDEYIVRTTLGQLSPKKMLSKIMSLSEKVINTVNRYSQDINYFDHKDTLTNISENLQTLVERLKEIFPDLMSR
ncbi:MAG: hypothetical protein ACO2OW_00170 [Minisyncoccia bacterium]|jgi:hypothetical protein